MDPLADYLRFTRPEVAMKREELLGLLRARHAKAVRHVLSTLRSFGGNVQDTADALGLGARTLYRQCERIPELRRGFERHAQGRAGSSRAGVAARLAKTS
jgi:DNA-binding NtrC family response regulator